MDDVRTEATPPSEFASILLALAKGQTHDELTTTLARVSAAVVETGKAGSLTLTLKVKPAKDVDGMVVFDDAISAKVPEFDRPATAFFVSDDGELTLQHPRQLGMFTVGSER